MPKTSESVVATSPKPELSETEQIFRALSGMKIGHRCPEVQTCPHCNERYRPYCEICDGTDRLWKLLDMAKRLNEEEAKKKAGRA